MPWAEFLILESILIIAVLIFFRSRPKPKWIELEIKAIKSIARLIGLIKRVMNVH